MTIVRNPGRPRDPAIHEAIAAACRELIVELGYAGLTIEAVAERAGVGRPTIYRRWPSKAHLVWDVLFTTSTDATLIGDTADLRADVEIWVRTTVDFFSQLDVARAFPGLLVDRSVEDDWHAHLRDPVRAAVLARLRRGVADGDLRPDADLAAIFDLVTGFAVYRAMVPQPVGRGPSASAIAEQLLRGALSRRE